MPFVKREVTAAPAPPLDDGPGQHLAALTSPDPQARWSAARALGGRAEAIAALATALAIEQAPQVREAIMTALVRTPGEASVSALLPYLRSQNAGERAAAIEALQAMPAAILPFMGALLSDDDSDVRILATELARNLPAPEATRVLCECLDQEQHPNVCGAAIDVLAEVGTREALPVLARCAERFAGTPFIAFAVAAATAQISNPEGPDGGS